MDHGSAMTYQLETCELPLLKNPDFISYMGENKVNPLLTYQYQRENVQIETDPLLCE